jgi:SAM-dependent methyltransferase
MRSRTQLGFERKNREALQSPAAYLSGMTHNEQEYVLGTGDTEIQRLGLQHSVWRPDATAAWQRAGFHPGDVILDVGCGPGFAALDLAEVVRPGGQVIAIDQSRRFLRHVDAQCRARGVDNIATRFADLNDFDFVGLYASGAWVRWVLAFTRDPRRVLAGIAGALKPGGYVVVHEYFAYETWRRVPHDAAFADFVGAVMASWRTRGGEPNVGLQLVPWLEELGFAVEQTRTIAHLVNVGDHRWHWPAAFATSGLDRLIELGDISDHAVLPLRKSIDELARSGSWMMTPAVLEVIARRL